MKFKKAYLLFSLTVLFPGIMSLFFYGLNLSNDFTGGSIITIEYGVDENTAVLDFISDYMSQNNIVIKSLSSAERDISVNTSPMSPIQISDFRNEIEGEFAGLGLNLTSSETIGPSVGSQTTRRAFIALGLVVVGIVVYIAYSFRNVPKPYSGFRFGVSAIIAMLHDAVLVLGVFSILGYFLKIQIDTLFITAILTVIGFSVHDSIVVFDRIRENLKKLPKSWTFESIVNYSIVETLNRSLGTSLTVLLPLISLFVLGGNSLKNFVLALLLGIFSGTYSSIFTASPLLIVWEERIAKSQKK